MKDETSLGPLSDVILTIFEADVPSGVSRRGLRSCFLGSWIRKGSCTQSHAARAGRDCFLLTVVMESCHSPSQRVIATSRERLDRSSRGVNDSCVTNRRIVKGIHRSPLDPRLAACLSGRSFLVLLARGRGRRMTASPRGQRGSIAFISSWEPLSLSAPAWFESRPSRAYSRPGSW